MATTPDVNAAQYRALVLASTDIPDALDDLSADAAADLVAQGLAQRTADGRTVPTLTGMDHVGY